MISVLSLPLAYVTIETGTNEDWVDSLLYLVNEGGPQLDLRGIKFEMEIRHRVDNHEVVIDASTDNGLLVIGDYPNYGYLVINIGHELMINQLPGGYVGDIVADDGTNLRRTANIDLTLIEGVTR
jgi:hypothetical protein